LVQELRAQGAQVDHISIYTTEPAAITPVQLDELANGVEAILFTSGSAVANFVCALKGRGPAEAAVQRAQIFCIGPVTAVAAQDAGLPAAVVADEATIDGLIDTLCRHLVQPKDSQHG
jgi:uroporphyrinogen III methyltransferase/synthase